MGRSEWAETALREGLCRERCRVSGMTDTVRRRYGPGRRPGPYKEEFDVKRPGERRFQPLNEGPPFPPLVQV